MSLAGDIANIVLPVFLVIGLGVLVRRLGFVDEGFIDKANRLVYNVCLPLLLFQEIGRADFFASFNPTLVAITLGAVLVTAAASYLYAAARGYPPAKLGVFSLGAFRGNIAYVGLAIVLNASGQEGLARASILMGFLVPLFNVLSVLALILPHRGRGEGGPGADWGRQILRNPLIIASLAGMAASILGVKLPDFLGKSLSIATGMTLPLALVGIGGSFSPARLRGHLAPTLLASAVKLLWLPVLTGFGLHWAGVRGLDLEIGVLLAAPPAATANFVMAQQMRGDAELSASIVMVSTGLSALTYAAALFALRSLGGL